MSDVRNIIAICLCVLIISYVMKTTGVLADSITCEDNRVDDGSGNCVCKPGYKEIIRDGKAVCVPEDEKDEDRGLEQEEARDYFRMNNIFDFKGKNANQSEDTSIYDEKAPGFYPPMDPKRLDRNSIKAITEDALKIASRTKDTNNQPFMTDRNRTISSGEGSSGYLVTPVRRIDNNYGRGTFERGTKETIQPTPQDIYGQNKYDVDRANSQAKNSISAQIRENFKTQITEWAHGDVMTGELPTNELFRPYCPLPLIKNGDLENYRTLNGRAEVDTHERLPTENAASSYDRFNVALDKDYQNYPSHADVRDSKVIPAHMRDTTIRGNRDNEFPHAANPLNPGTALPRGEENRGEFRWTREKTFPDTMANPFSNNGSSFTAGVTKHFVGSENKDVSCDLNYEKMRDYLDAENTRPQVDRIIPQGQDIGPQMKLAPKRFEDIELRDTSMKVSEVQNERIVRNDIYGRSENKKENVRLDKEFRENRAQLSELMNRPFTGSQRISNIIGSGDFDKSTFNHGVPILA